jgi:hypothetical protein
MYVQCTRCLSSMTVAEGLDPHAVFQCRCCPEPHHHGEAANACPKEHDGPCWKGPQSGPLPEGCTVCRPLLFHANAVVNLAN